MRKLIVEVETAVNGTMGGEHGDFWQQLMQFHSDDVQAYLNDLLFTPDALLMGKLTYEAFATVWPTRQGPDADHINAMPKYVASTSLHAPLQWNSTLIEGDVVAAVTQLKQAPGHSLLQYGVGELTETLLKAGLVDELRIILYPFTYGEGPRLFERMGLYTLKLLSTKQFSSGAVALHYQPASSPG